tara:strand:+ start:819 stop:1454 length:636 start_codon:yes stop_codon:yes gene_type:complete
MEKIMSEVLPFKFERRRIRVVSDDQEGVWFVGQDICTALELAKPENALSRLDEDEKRTHLIETPGGRQHMTTINESGLYSLIFSSRKAAARRFKKWVTRDVLPAIRSTGQYIDQQSEPTAVDEPVVTMSQSKYTEMLVRTIDDQAKIIQFLEVEKERRDMRKNMKIARFYIEETNLSDAEIAQWMEDLIGEYLPEWVAWRRRVISEKANQV